MISGTMFCERCGKELEDCMNGISNYSLLVKEGDKYRRVNHNLLEENRVFKYYCEECSNKLLVEK